MSSPRLFFLYPRLFRTARLGESAAQTAGGSRRNNPRAAAAIRRQPSSPFGSATKPRQAHFVKRHGKAVEPTPLHGEAAKPSAAEEAKESGENAAKAEKKEPVKEKGKTKNTSGNKTADMAKQANPDNEPPKPETTTQADPEPQPGGDGESNPAQTHPDPTTGRTASGGPMETVLHMGPPQDHQEGPGPPPRTPHLTPSPYVHHFDSYSLVKQLAGGGWTSVQAITAMKAIRGILASNLDVAQAGLVSKSDVENETYLFRAACSELGAELRNSRRAADEQLRQQRTTLQHEVDILTQSLNQEVLTLNDSVRGMFNDRKMAVREEQKAAESAVSGLRF